MELSRAHPPPLQANIAKASLKGCDLRYAKYDIHVLGQKQQTSTVTFGAVNWRNMHLAGYDFSQCELREAAPLPCQAPWCEEGF